MKSSCVPCKQHILNRIRLIYSKCASNQLKAFYVVEWTKAANALKQASNLYIFTFYWEGCWPRALWRTREITKKYKYMLKCDISWINHGRPLACSLPQPAAYSHHTFAPCVLEFTHKLLRCWAFSEITTTAHVLCFPFNIWVHTRPWQQLSLTTPFKACWLKCHRV